MDWPPLTFPTMAPSLRVQALGLYSQFSKLVPSKIFVRPLAARGPSADVTAPASGISTGAPPVPGAVPPVPLDPPVGVGVVAASGVLPPLPPPPAPPVSPGSGSGSERGGSEDA